MALLLVKIKLAGKMHLPDRHHLPNALLLLYRNPMYPMCHVVDYQEKTLSNSLQKQNLLNGTKVLVFLKGLVNIENNDIERKC